MKFIRSLSVLILLAVCGPTMAQATPFHRGVNLSNWFQARNAQAIEFSRYGKQDFEHIRALGCDVVRLPINLHSMTGGAPGYRLDPLFLDYLNRVVDWAEALDLHLIFDNHTFSPRVATDPAIGAVLEKVWVQMAEHFRDRSGQLYYEILNEPHGIPLAAWNDIQRAVIAAIRTVDDRRTIIVGGAGWNSYTSLPTLPEYRDDKLIYTFHFYDPFLFTHQGAGWMDPSMTPLSGVPFPYDARAMPEMPATFAGTWMESAYGNYPVDGTVSRVRELLDTALRFRAERQVPLLLGEFGVLMHNADPEHRVAWYRAVREYVEAHGIAWTSWDYHGSFGLFQPGSEGRFDRDLNRPLLRALGLEVPPQKP
jgi:endoglucanase